MGEAKRRKAAGHQSTARIEILDPRERAYEPGSVLLHVIHEGGASVSGAIRHEQIDEAIALIKRTSGGQTRESARSWLCDMLTRGEYMAEPGANIAILTALWLAVTAPGEMGEAVRAVMKQDIVIATFLSEYTINGRMALFAPSTTLDEVLQLGGFGPRAEAVTQRLAPH